MVGSLLIEFQKKLVSRIREIREAQKISQQDLAKLARVSRQTIYYLERGQSNPSTLLSIKIAKILNKKVEEIFYDEPVIRDFLRNKTLGELDEVSELTKIAIVHLYVQGFEDAELVNFELTLTNPSIVYEQEKLNGVISKKTL